MRIRRTCMWVFAGLVACSQGLGCGSSAGDEEPPRDRCAFSGAMPADGYPDAPVAFIEDWVPGAWEPWRTQSSTGGVRTFGGRPYCIFFDAPALNCEVLDPENPVEMHFCGGGPWGYIEVGSAVACSVSTAEDEIWSGLPDAVHDHEFVVAFNNGDATKCGSWTAFGMGHLALWGVDGASARAEYLGGLTFDWDDANSVPVLKGCWHFAFDAEPLPLVATSASGYTLDMRRRHDRDPSPHMLVFEAPVGGSVERGWMNSPNGEERPITWPYVPPVPPERYSEVVPELPYCRPLDEGGPHGDALRYEFGYFPVGIVPGMNGATAEELEAWRENPEDTSLGRLGVHPTDSLPAAWYWDEEDRRYGCTEAECRTDEKYVIIVGKWMAPFCEGWGLPRGILRHIVNLQTDTVHGPLWFPFTECFWNQPWHWEPFSKQPWHWEPLRGTVGDVTIEVAGGVPEDFETWRLPGAVRLSRGPLQSVAIDLPLRR